MSNYHEEMLKLVINLMDEEHLKDLKVSVQSHLNNLDYNKDYEIDPFTEMDQVRKLIDQIDDDLDHRHK